MIRDEKSADPEQWLVIMSQYHDQGLSIIDHFTITLEQLKASLRNLEPFHDVLMRASGNITLPEVQQHHRQMMRLDHQNNLRLLKTKLEQRNLPPEEQQSIDTLITQHKVFLDFIHSVNPGVPYPKTEFQQTRTYIRPPFADTPSSALPPTYDIDASIETRPEHE